MAAALSVSVAASAARIEIRGALDAPADLPVVVVSTDPLIQQVLNEDLQLAGRLPRSGESKSLTLTVVSNQRLLQPGVSLADVAAGHPEVASMLEAAGATAPPLGDTGSNTYENAANPGAPVDPELLAFRREQERLRVFATAPHDPSPYDNLAPAAIYDTAVVTHAALNDHPGGVTIVAVIHPGEDQRATRKLIAEKIANLILR